MIEIDWTTVITTVIGAIAILGACSMLMRGMLGKPKKKARAREHRAMIKAHTEMARVAWDTMLITAPPTDSHGRPLPLADDSREHVVAKGGEGPYDHRRASSTGADTDESVETRLAIYAVDEARDRIYKQLLKDGERFCQTCGKLFETVDPRDHRKLCAKCAAREE